MVEIDTTIECGGVSVSKGDAVFGDSDGVVVLPAAISSAVVQRALEKAGTENRSREELRKGVLLAEVYRRYGVL
jgi:regulator of RNase E activity RraA